MIGIFAAMSALLLHFIQIAFSTGRWQVFRLKWIRVELRNASGFLFHFSALSKRLFQFHFLQNDNYLLPFSAGTFLLLISWDNARRVT